MDNADGHPLLPGGTLDQRVEGLTAVLNSLTSLPTDEAMSPRITPPLGSPSPTITPPFTPEIRSPLPLRASSKINLRDWETELVTTTTIPGELQDQSELYQILSGFQTPPTPHLSFSQMVDQMTADPVQAHRVPTPETFFNLQAAIQTNSNESSNSGVIRGTSITIHGGSRPISPAMNDFQDLTVNEEKREVSAPPSPTMTTKKTGKTMKISQMETLSLTISPKEKKKKKAILKRKIGSRSPNTEGEDTLVPIPSSSPVTKKAKLTSLQKASKTPNGKLLFTFLHYTNSVFFNQLNHQWFPKYNFCPVTDSPMDIFNFNL